MKKIYLLLVLAAFGLETMAQTFVSTTPEKKNAVLEEYTGIYCGWCPAGHKIAQGMKENNPKDIVLVNVHSSTTYAAPKAGSGDPDFRTPYGDVLASTDKVNSYPAGSINRKVFANSQNGGTSMSRSYWEASANQILAENSPVNVAVQTTLDLEKRELIIDVEVYYTADATNSTNKLNIALLQNNIEGPQSGAEANYPENILPNGKYNHQHVLRDFITGQWGDDIPSTKKGDFFEKTYTYSIPKDLKGVEIDLMNLEVAAYVAEGQQDILTGVSEIVLVPEEYRADLATADASVKENGICATSITPKINVTNEGDNTIESFDVVASINGNDVTKSFSGTLAKGESTIIEWDAINLPGGSYSLTISKISNINNDKLIDQNKANSPEITIEGHSFLANAISTGFEATFNGTLPANTALDKSQNEKFEMFYSTSYPYGAKASYGTLRYFLHSSWNVAGKPADVIFGKADLSSTSNPFISYWYAYSDGGQGGTAPTIKIEISEDCGDTWNTVHTENARETGQPSDPARLYEPSYNEYRRIYASLEDYKDSEVIVRVRMTPGTSGNALFIDEINMISDATSISEKAVNSFSVFPNPFQNEANITFNLNETKNIEVKVYDALGRVVKTINNQEYQAGTNNLSISTADLDEGMYVLRAESNGVELTSQVIIKE